jgi:hypothetical protein
MAAIAVPPRRPTLMPRFALALVALAALAGPAAAQQPTPQDSGPIQDNSFLIEEAYNQEAGVVQHINTYQLTRGGAWAYTFTQEWPAGSIKHQVSYTVAALGLGDDSCHGFGDTALNYRYQLVGDGESKVAISPRVSLLLPTGDSRRELGAGGVAVQFNLPVSVVLSRQFVTHWNAGTTITPSEKDAAGDTARAVGYNLGQSIVWLARTNVNLLLETVWTRARAVVARGRTVRDDTFLLNPGVRWAYTFHNGLQIVPGVAVPLGVGPSSGQRGVFLYLSFEHPFGHPH